MPHDFRASSAVIAKRWVIHPGQKPYHILLYNTRGILTPTAPGIGPDVIKSISLFTVHQPLLMNYNEKDEVAFVLGQTIQPAQWHDPTNGVQNASHL